jgi:NRAMP (natural resistance-associated macrophage protein)-like metal ion transporter
VLSNPVLIPGRNLAQACADEYPKPLRVVLWFCTELAVIAADIPEVVGTAIAIGLLSNNAVPLWAGVVITGVDTVLFLAIQHFGVRWLEGFIGFLVAIMSACFIVEVSLAMPDTVASLKGLAIPTVPEGSIFVAVSLVGAVVMPHNLYLHSALVQVAIS